MPQPQTVQPQLLTPLTLSPADRQDVYQAERLIESLDVAISKWHAAENVEGRNAPAALLDVADLHSKARELAKTFAAITRRHRTRRLARVLRGSPLEG